MFLLGTRPLDHQPLRAFKRHLHSPRRFFRPSSLRPIFQQPLEQHDLRPIPHRRHQSFQNADRVRIAPVVQDPPQEIDIRPFDRLLGEEVVPHELDPTTQVFRHQSLPMRDDILLVLHDEPDMLRSSSQSLRHRALAPAHIDHDRARPIDQIPRVSVDQVFQIPALERAEPLHGASEPSGSFRMLGQVLEHCDARLVGQRVRRLGGLAAVAELPQGVRDPCGALPRLFGGHCDAVLQVGFRGQEAG